MIGSAEEADVRSIRLENAQIFDHVISAVECTTEGIAASGTADGLERSALHVDIAHEHDRFSVKGVAVANHVRKQTKLL